MDFITNGYFEMKIQDVTDLKILTSLLEDGFLYHW